jgi:hypothetical protein
MSKLFINGGVRYTQDYLARCGIPEGQETQFGYTEISVALPEGFNPLFESAVDSGTDFTEAGPVVRWTLVELDIDTARSQLKARVAAIRYAYEVMGCEWNGHKLRTDREARAIMPEISAWTDGDMFKIADGSFITMTIVEYTAMKAAINAYVQQQYRREGEIVALADVASTVAQLRAIDLTWA